jgi:hypothetical protein
LENTTPVKFALLKTLDIATMASHPPGIQGMSVEGNFNLPGRIWRHPMRSARFWTIAVSVATAGAANISGARADEAQAKSLLKAMSDYLGAQKAISFEYDTNLDIVSPEKQKVGLASSGIVVLNRPDKLHITRMGLLAQLS